MMKYRNPLDFFDELTIIADSRHWGNIYDKILYFFSVTAKKEQNIWLALLINSDYLKTLASIALLESNNITATIFLRSIFKMSKVC